MAEIINGTNGNDRLVNTVSGSKVNGLDGNDTLTNSADATVSGGTFQFGGDDVTLNGDAGNDYIYSGRSTGDLYYYHLGIHANGGTGNDYIRLYARNSSADGGDDQDTINAYGNENSIFGGEGRDSITICISSTATTTKLGFKDFSTRRRSAGFTKSA